MKTTCFTWLAAALLALPGVALAQATGPAEPPPTATDEYRVVLGGPPRPAAPADTSSAAALPLPQQVAALRQQLASLRSQLAATRHFASELLLDHAELESLRQQLHLLQAQRAAAFATSRRPLGWPVD